MLRMAGMVKKTNGTAALSLKAEAGQSIRVRDIFNYVDAAIAESVSITVNRKTVMQFVAPAAWFLLNGIHHSGYTSIFSALRNRGLLSDIPIAEGETLEITAPGAGHYTEVVYDLYDGPDVRATEKNGSQASRYDFFQVISNSGVRATAGDLSLDKSDVGSIFPAFPGGELVPARTKMTLKALFGAGASLGTGAANGEYTTYLKMLSNREDILDSDLTGMHFLGNAAVTAAAVSYASICSRLDLGVALQEPRIIVFEEPIVFEAGSELNVIATIARTGAGGDFIAGSVKLGMLFDVEYQ